MIWGPSGAEWQNEWRRMQAGFKTDADRTEDTPELEPIIVPATPEPEKVPA